MPGACGNCSSSIRAAPGSRSILRRRKAPSRKADGRKLRRQPDRSSARRRTGPGDRAHDGLMERLEEAMDDLRSFPVGLHRITLALREDVGPVSLYSQLLAEHIPDLTGRSVIDVGSGSGFLSIVASLQGAKCVDLLDSYDAAIELALQNAKRNGVRDGLVHLPMGNAMIPLPP